MAELQITTGQTVVPPPVRGWAIRNRWLRTLVRFLVVFGPGLIVMEADNDAGAVSTYMQAGGQYGTSLLWTLLLLLPITYFAQEMVARLGVVTGRGHAAMIYRRFGRWWGLFSMLDLQIVNFFTLVTEFAAISLATARLGLAPQVAVPLFALGLIMLVITGSYLRWEWMTIGLCLLDVTWFALAGRVGIPVAESLRHTLIPAAPAGGFTTDVVFLIIALVGTTIAPWQLFFQQSCVADKRLRMADLKYAQLDTFVGACFTILVAGAMMLVGNAALTRHISFQDPAQTAVALFRFDGPFVRNGILLLMCNAAVLGATAVSLSSAWAYAEVRGWPHSLQLPLPRACGFYSLYILAVAGAAGLVLIPRAPLQLIIVSVQVLAGLILPSAIIFLQLLLNDRAVLGERFVNRPWNNVVNWAIIAVLFALSLVLAAQVLLPGIVPGGAG
jgi:NRAMP (natural resistance-associated macrophage protein)-like metal ion transporter